MERGLPLTVVELNGMGYEAGHAFLDDQVGSSGAVCLREVKGVCSWKSLGTRGFFLQGACT